MKNEVLIGQRIQNARKARHLSLLDLGQRLGVHKSTVSRWERGVVDNISLATISKLADVLQVNSAWLAGKDAPMILPDKNDRKFVPVYGRIRGGIPIEAIQEILDYEEITEEMARNGDYIALRVTGDSMAPRIAEGDVVIIRCQPTVENGEIAAVMVNGSDATLKKFYRSGDQVTLVSLNPNYTPLVYDLSETPVSILGRLVELRAKY